MQRCKKSPYFKLFYIIFLIIYNIILIKIITPAAQDETIETQNIWQFLDKFSNEEIIIIERNSYFIIKNSYDETLFVSTKISENVYVDTDILNIRTIPTINSKCFNKLQRNTKVRRVGQSTCGWDIIQINNQYFFVWTEFLTTQQPDVFIQIVNLQQQQEILSSSPAIDIIQQQAIIETQPVVETYVAPTPPPLTHLGAFRITFYCLCAQCCGQWYGHGITASGAAPAPWYTCACGDSIPFGTVLYVQGLGIFVCQDRGVPEGCIDIFVSNHAEIPSWGMAYLNTYIVN